MKYNYCFTLQYDGTRYNGWQRQGNTERTIQGLLEEKLSQLFGEKVDLKGSGRTDRGVHATGQMANCIVRKKMELDMLKNQINKELPDDIRVNGIVLKPLDFHSRKSAKKKTYEYCIWNSMEKNVFYRNVATEVEEPLNIVKMQQAVECILGTHDFIGFSSLKETNKNTVRSIYQVEIEQIQQRIYIRYTGDGFLYHMVRILTGTLIEIGKGRMEADAVRKVLEEKNREYAGPTAPAQGLKLVDVFY